MKAADRMAILIADYHRHGDQVDPAAEGHRSMVRNHLWFACGGSGSGSLGHAGGAMRTTQHRISKRTLMTPLLSLFYVPIVSSVSSFRRATLGRQHPSIERPLLERYW
jgi:hypothetical protein